MENTTKVGRPSTGAISGVETKERRNDGIMTCHSQTESHGQILESTELSERCWTGVLDRHAA